MKSFRLSAKTIVLLYLMMGYGWIILTDLMVGNADVLEVGSTAYWQTLKGLIYVSLTGGLLYILIKVYAKREMNMRNALELKRFMERHVHDALLILDAEERILNINEKAISWLGFGTADEAVGLKLVYEDATEGGDKEVLKIQNRHEEWMWADCKKLTLSNNRQLWVCRDLTTEQKLKNEVLASETRYSILFRHNPVLAWVFDPETLNIVDVNLAAIRLYGYSYEEFTQLNLRDLRPEEEWARMQAAIRDAPERYPASVWKHKKKDGTIFFIRAQSDLIDYGGRKMRLVMATDATQQLQIEKEYSEMLLNSQRQLLATAIKMQEDERKRIAGDLHDSVGQLLAATSMCLSQLADEDTRPESRRQIVTNANEYLLQSIQELRNITRNLRPRQLEELGLEMALRVLVEQFNKMGRGQVLFTNHIKDLRLPDLTETMLYRLTQELVNNALKHAKADTILLSLMENNEMLYFTIEDDGVGFDAKISKYDSLGMSTIPERVQTLGGKVEINSIPGQGTLVCISLPVLKIAG